MKIQYAVYKFDYQEFTIPSYDYDSNRDFYNEYIKIFRMYEKFETELEAVEYIEKNLKQYEEFVLVFYKFENNCKNLFKINV